MSAANPYLTDPTPDGRLFDGLGDIRRLVDQALRNMGTAGDGSVKAGALAADSVTTGTIAAGSITTDLLAAGAVIASKIAANTITAAQIAANTITAGQIAASTITATEIASATITGALIAAATITATNIAAATITSTLLAANAVTAGAIATGAVTATKISVSSLSAISADLGTITAGTVTGATLRTASSGKRVVLDAGGITGYGGTGSTVVFAFDTTTGNLTLTGVVTASAGSVLPATAIDATAGGIVSAQIQNGTIVGADIAANTIAANNIIAATITATELATDSVTSVKILANTIVAGDIASGTITAAQIQAGSITADRLGVTQLSAIAADLGTITAGTVTGALIRTASSGARVEVVGSANAMKVYSSSTQVQQIDGTRGVNFVMPTSAFDSQSILWTSTIGNAWGAGSARLYAWNSGGTTQTGVQAWPSSTSGAGQVLLQGYRFGGTSAALLTVDGSTDTLKLPQIQVGVLAADNVTTKTTTLIDVNGDMTVPGTIKGPTVAGTATNFMKGLTTNKIVTNWGRTTATFSASPNSADVTVNHGLGVTPQIVILTGEDGTAYPCPILKTTNSTSFTFYVRDVTNVNRTGTNVVDWFALGYS